MNHKRTTMSIFLATVMLVSLFAVVSSAASVSGQTSGTTAPLVGGILAGSGPAVSGSSNTLTVPAGYSDYANFFAVDTSGTLWHTNGSGAWDSLGGVSTASPAAISWNSSYFRLDVFVRGSNGALYHKYYQNGWSGWENLGGQLASGTGPAVASWNGGRLDVFVEGNNGALYHKWYSGGAWSGWENLGGKLTASPAATFDPNVPHPSANNIDVFVRGTDGAVWWKDWNGSAWSSWTSLGGQVASGTGPAASPSLFLFVQGTDHQLWHKIVGSGGTAWSTLGGAPPEALSNASPAAVLIVASQTIVVCVISTSGNVWWSGSSVQPLWPQWTSIGSPP
jgi:hypothetical protein